jgi:hypothetical protein
VLAEVHRRIVNSKYIFERSEILLSDGHEMSTSLALLLTHDAIEMLMLAVLDHIGGKSGRNFMDFWPEMKVATGKEPPDRIPMESLNKLRVGLKHSGNRPHDQTVKDLAIRSKGF